MKPIKINIGEYVKRIEASGRLSDLLDVLTGLLIDLSTDANLNRRVEFATLFDALRSRREFLCGMQKGVDA